MTVDDAAEPVGGRPLRIAAAVAVAGIVAGIVFLRPGPAGGPEPIAYGHDACASCRTPVRRPGFAGELRDADGTLRKYDDVGCLVRAILEGRGTPEAAWVEDHVDGGFVPLRRAYLVGGPPQATPMGSGLVAFAEASTARRWADAHGGRVMGFDDAIRDAVLLSRLTSGEPVPGVRSHGSDRPGAGAPADGPARVLGQASVPRREEHEGAADQDQDGDLDEQPGGHQLVEGDRSVESWR